MAKINIYIPDEFALLMDTFAYIPWSQIARDAWAEAMKNPGKYKKHDIGYWLPPSATVYVIEVAGTSEAQRVWDELNFRFNMSTERPE